MRLGSPTVPAPLGLGGEGVVPYWKQGFCLVSELRLLGHTHTPVQSRAALHPGLGTAWSECTHPAPPLAEEKTAALAPHLPLVKLYFLCFSKL